MEGLSITRQYLEHSDVEQRCIYYRHLEISGERGLRPLVSASALVFRGKGSTGIFVGKVTTPPENLRLKIGMVSKVHNIE